MIDTNVVMDVLLKREPFFQASYDVMKKSALEQIEAYVSATAATEIFYLLRRALKDNQAAKGSLEKLTHLVGFVDTLAEDVYAAMASNMTDFEDALVSAMAERNRMDCIVTRNVKDFKDSSVKALTPEAFLVL